MGFLLLPFFLLTSNKYSTTFNTANPFPFVMNPPKQKYKHDRKQNKRDKIADILSFLFFLLYLIPNTTTHSHNTQQHKEGKTNRITHIHTFSK